MRTSATLALTLLVLIALLAGGNVASANSLPGDLLYGVKRASEEVRMLLTTDAQSRSALQQELEERRVVEVQQVVEQKREVRVEFGGIVEKIEEDTITIQGIPVKLASPSLTSKTPAIGAKVQVVAQTEPSGQITAQSLQIEAEPPTVAATPPSSRSELSAADRRPTDTPPALPKPTQTEAPPDTPSAAPSSATPTATATLGVPSTIEIIPAVTWTPSVTLAPSATRPPPAETKAPTPQEVQVRIEGRIDAMGSSQWIVAGQRIGLEPSTRVRQDQARPEVGGRAVVRAVRRADGTLVAREIEIVQGPKDEPRHIEFSGAIESISDGSWSVAGRRVSITSSTVIEGTPTVGARANVKADEYPDSRLVAHEITVEAPAERPVAFAGVIQSINAGDWVIAGQRVLISGETQISGDPIVGAIAEVSAVVRSDESMLARRISVRALPQPTPTLSATPTMTEQPTHTPLPPTEAPPTQTPSEPTATQTEAMPSVSPPDVMPSLTPSEVAPSPTPSETPGPLSGATPTPSAKPLTPTATASAKPTSIDEKTLPTATSQLSEIDGTPTVDTVEASAEDAKSDALSVPTASPFGVSLSELIRKSP